MHVLLQTIATLSGILQRTPVRYKLECINFKISSASVASIHNKVSYLYVISLYVCGSEAFAAQIAFPFRKYGLSGTTKIVFVITKH